MTVGDRIRQQREAKGITQLELARRIGYTTTGAISLIESGKRDLSLDKVREIAKAVSSYFFALKKGTAPKNCPITKEKRKMKKPN